MKKQLLFIFSLFIFNVSYSQITLEHTYPIITSNYGGISLTLVKFSSIGDKYAILDRNINQLKIYSLNHSLYKTINIPAPSLATTSSISLEIINISDNLFNNDNLIEVAYQYDHYESSLGLSIGEVAVIDENLTSLFHKDSAYFDGGYHNTTYSSDDYGIIKTTGGLKMAIQYSKAYDKSFEVYSLPGQLVTVLNTPKYEPSKFMIYPNPADSYTKIDFEIDNGQTGDIIIYSADGKIVKRYKVDGAFGSLLLNSQDLPTGEYVYQLTTAKSSGSKKVIVIH
jgi:hypothetical protein